MSSSFDVAAVGNAIVDVLAPASDAFLRGENVFRLTLQEQLLP